MAKGFLLSKRDASRLQKMLRWFDKRVETRYQRRRRHGGAGGGSDIRIAYCKTASPDSDEIDVFLGTDTTGQEVTAKALIVNGTSLMYSAPFLKDGDPVFVSKVTVDETSTWHIIGVPFNGARYV